MEVTCELADKKKKKRWQTWRILLSVKEKNEYVWPLMVTMIVRPLMNESEVYFAISITGREPETSTQLKQSFRVFSKWFIGNVVTRASYNEYVHPLQSLFLFSLLSNLKMNIGYIIFVFKHATCVVISSRKAPAIAKLSLPYGMLLPVIFDHFHIPVSNPLGLVPLISPPSSLWT